MPGLHLQILRYVDDSFPGWVECQLFDAEGREHLFVEKVPVVASEDLDAESPSPQPTFVECTVLERSLRGDGRDLVTVDTDKPWGIVSTEVPEQGGDS
jgi:hypothetical protein